MDAREEAIAVWLGAGAGLKEIVIRGFKARQNTDFANKAGRNRLSLSLDAAVSDALVAIYRALKLSFYWNQAQWPMPGAADVLPSSAVVPCSGREEPPGDRKSVV